MQPKILFLYTELAGYFLACVKELAKRNVDVHIVHWPVNKEAPFRFQFPPEVKTYDRSELSDEELAKLVRRINPSLIYTSGWIDKSYVAICRSYKKSIPVIVGFDNQWKGTLKQWVAVIAARWVIHRNFTHCWVPGTLQVKFAKKLGFDDSKILTGFYCCDFEYFNAQYAANYPIKQNQLPHRFIYAGRYYSFKGITDLWQAFNELQQEFPCDWELWCLGTGDIEPFAHPAIRHIGFVQPGDMDRYLRETSVFILPSHFEPWGVVVHEFAAAGFPLIVSDEVGARTAFVQNEHNGYIYKAGNKDELKKNMLKMIKLSDSELLAMGDRSAELAKRITPITWADTLMTLILQSR